MVTGSGSFTGRRSRRGAFFMPPEPGSPAAYEEVDEEEYLDALRTAERVMLWAGKVLDR
jgi:hypothetical protein